jgi:hypothetical protein
MEIKDTEYSIQFDSSNNVLSMRGKLRLQSLRGYDSIRKLFYEAAEKVRKGSLILDLTNLESLNSSGVTVLSTFVISLRKANQLGLKIIYNPRHSWQKYSVPNLKKLWNQVEVIEV